MERDYVNRTIIVSEDPFARDVAIHFILEGARFLVEEFRTSKNYHHVPFTSFFDPNKLTRIELTWVGEEKGFQIGKVTLLASLSLSKCAR